MGFQGSDEILLGLTEGFTTTRKYGKTFQLSLSLFVLSGIPSRLFLFLALNCFT